MNNPIKHPDRPPPDHPERKSWDEHYKHWHPSDWF